MYHNSVSKLTVATHNPAGGALRGLSILLGLSSPKPTPTTEVVDPLDSARSGSTAVPVGGLLWCSAGVITMASGVLW